MRSTSRTLIVIGTVLLTLAAGCTPAPPVGPLPETVATCASASGDVLYSPPGIRGGPPVTLEILPGAGLFGCVDNTGQGVTGGSFLDTHIGLLESGCEYAPSTPQTLLGTGGGQILWSNLATSQFNVTVYHGFPYGTGVWEFRLTIFTGLWAGATATFFVHATASSGNCVDIPVILATAESTGPVVFNGPTP